MKLAVIGVGNAGSKIADRLLEYEHTSGRSLLRSVTAVNTARVDLARLEHIPEQNQELVGQTDVRSKGRGAGGDPDLGAEIVEADLYEIHQSLDRTPIYDIDAFLVIAGLGGGTGSGGGQAIAAMLRDTYDDPVYGLGVLPAVEEGGRATLNAARSLPSFGEATDNLFLFDNDQWRETGATIHGNYDRTNTEIAKRIVTLLGAGEIDGSQVSENAMDASDIKRTLATGGVSVIGYTETDLNRSTGRNGLLDRFRNQSDGDAEVDVATKVNGVIKQAVHSRLTCDAVVESAERSLAVVSGPPPELSRKGLETGRRWLEETTESVEVLAGDDPRPDAQSLIGVVLLSNVTDVPRVDELQERAQEAQRNIENQSRDREAEIRELLMDEDNELNPV